MPNWRPNLSWITPTLAVGGSFPAERTQQLAHDLAIRAVVDLRGEACDDIELLRAHGVSFLHLPTEDLAAVDQPLLDLGVAFANRHLNLEERVLIHCEHGIGRSATLALCVLVSRGVAPLDALESAKSARSLVSPSPRQYEAWVAWMRRWGKARRPRIEPPSFDAFKAIAYRHLRTEGAE